MFCKQFMNRVAEYRPDKTDTDEVKASAYADQRAYIKKMQDKTMNADCKVHCLVHKHRCPLGWHEFPTQR
eukprot:10849289-Alexandrium_andersonii.AAC.1